MLAFRLSRDTSNTKYTYGYKKSTVLASLLNAVILLIAVGFILGESINKLFHPQPVDGDAVAWVARSRSSHQWDHGLVVHER